MDSKAARKQERAEKKKMEKLELQYYRQQLDALANCDKREQLAFPPTLTKAQRKKLHVYAHGIGLKSKSNGTGENRFLIIYKKDVIPVILTDENTTTFTLSEETIKNIGDLLSSDPPKANEKQNILLQPSGGSSHAHLPFMFGDSRSRTKVTVPPFARGIDSLNAVRKSLPIFEHRDEILTAIHQNQVVVISGETGSGKTTQVPQYIMEDCSQRGLECRIICTQPRRLAATSIATRISEERNDTLGRSVGYQIRLDSRIMQTTNLIFTTSGFLLRCLTGSKQEDVYKNLTHLIIDEVHEREKVTDFLLIAIRDALPANKHLKVILMSATLDSEQFSGYFHNCPVINVPGRLFDVDVLYLGDVLAATEYKSKKMEIYMAENQAPRMQRSNAVNLDQSSKNDGVANAQVAVSGEDIKFYDECFDECIDNDDDTAFEQIFCSISDDNMPVDYMHSTKLRTALGIASEKGFDDVLTRLLTLGANPTFQDGHGKTALDYAEENNQEVCCELLAHHQHFADTPQATPIIPQCNNIIDSHAKALQQFHLVAYQMTQMKWNEIDHELLHHVIARIHTEKPIDGSILVFLPGYEDIMTQKDLIETRFEMNNYQLFVLHSGVNGTNSTEQTRVFDRMPYGVRKIILSTNIAETSLTINDVVYVVDAGKVKQQTYDSISESTCLTSTDISQACAKQRSGRAGRIRNGFCYRLYSFEQYEAMEKYTLPEILRVPLTEICLNAKILSGDLSIKEFLLKALQPPSIKNICQSIELLKKINALDDGENITYLGLHLANMPVDCQLGKMILYSIVLRCLDPIVTIVSALSVKDPFMLPLGNEGETINQIKKNFARNSMSDHQMLLNTFEVWTKQTRKADFCKDNFISNGNMQMIQGVRRLIMGHLKMADLVKEDSARNIKKLNLNSDRWEIIKACIIAGMYPNICRFSNLNGQIYSKQDKKLLPHLSSILRYRKGRGQIDPNVLKIDAKWLVHGEKSRIASFSLIKSITLIPAIDIVLFAGPIQLPEDCITAAAEDNVEVESDVDCDDIPIDMIPSISPQFDDELFTTPGFGEIDSDVTFRIDDWISFSLDENEAYMLFKFREKFASMFSRFLRNSAGFEMTNKEEKMLNVLIETIRQEDRIEQSIKARTIMENEGDEQMIPDNPIIAAITAGNSRRLKTERTVERPTGPAFMSNAYNQAIHHDRDSKTKKQRHKKQQKEKAKTCSQPQLYRQTATYVDTNRTQYQSQPRDMSPQPSTSNAQYQLTKGLFNPLNALAPTFKPSNLSLNPLSLSAVPAFDMIPNRYFILTVRNVGHIYSSVFQRHWMFSTPLSYMRRVAQESAPSKVILLFHFQKKSSIFGYGQFQCNHQNYTINIDNNIGKHFRPLHTMEVINDYELTSDQGFEIYNICLNNAKLRVSELRI